MDLTRKISEVEEGEEVVHKYWFVLEEVMVVQGADYTAETLGQYADRKGEVGLNYHHHLLPAWMP